MLFSFFLLRLEQPLPLNKLHHILTGRWLLGLKQNSDFQLLGKKSPLTKQVEQI
jgi:hypothetical protein